MRVALVYDRVNKYGGAERVLMALHELYPDAPLYAAVYDKRHAAWADVFSVRPSFLNNLPFASSFHEVLPMLTPFAFEQFTFDQFDIVISVTSAEAKNIITKPQTYHICYCLTPTRYLWSGYDQYVKMPMLGFFLKKFVQVLRRLDLIASSRPDAYIAISERVKQRIEKYYKRDVHSVIYPPLEDDVFMQTKSSPKTKDNGYLLTVSRLVSYKRVDLLIRTCNALCVPLVIIGRGREEKALRKIAGKTITFVTRYLTEKELVSYYDNCRAFLYAADEDFGIAAVEAQARGKSVIAYKHSGVSESVIDVKTGILFEEQSVESIKQAIKKFDAAHILSIDCKNQAAQFSKERFKQKMTDTVMRIVSER